MLSRMNARGEQWFLRPFSLRTALRTGVNRQQPFGAEEWQARIAAALGLELTLRRRGRPLKASEK